MFKIKQDKVTKYKVDLSFSDAYLVDVKTISSFHGKMPIDRKAVVLIDNYKEKDLEQTALILMEFESTYVFQVVLPNFIHRNKETGTIEYIILSANSDVFAEQSKKSDEKK